MSTEETGKESALGDLAFILLLVIGGALVVSLGYFLLSNMGNVRNFIRQTDTYPLAISTTPSGATVVLDGKIIGKSPITTLTFPGAHVVSTRMDGYKAQSHAFDLRRDEYKQDKEWNYILVRKGTPWSYNYKLEVLSGISPRIGELDENFHSRIAALDTQIKDVRSLIIANPEQSLSYGLLKSRVDALEQKISNLNDQVEVSNNLSIALWATLAAIFLTLAVLVFSRRRSAP